MENHFKGTVNTGDRRICASVETKPGLKENKWDNAH